MAEISRFFGIIIYMYGYDHNPPHFHFTYGEYECIMYLDDWVIEGKAPSKVIKRVERWATENETELKLAWEKAQTGEPLPRIRPLFK